MSYVFVSSKLSKKSGPLCRIKLRQPPASLFGSFPLTSSPLPSFLPLCTVGISVFLLLTSQPGPNSGALTEVQWAMTMYLRLLPHAGRWIGKGKAHHLWQGCLPAHTWAHGHNTLLASTFPSRDSGLQGLSGPEAKKEIGSHPPWPWTFYPAFLLLLISNFPQCYSEISWENILVILNSI